MRIESDFGADARAIWLRSAIRGTEAVGAAPEGLIVTRDFGATVRRLTGSQDYASSRAGGAVPAKTLPGPPQIIVLDADFFEAFPATAERMAAHEACHVSMNSRRESTYFHHDLARTQNEYNRIAAAGEVLEEYRCEVTVFRRLRYPVMPGHARIELGAALSRQHSRTAFWKIVAVAAASAEDVDGDLEAYPEMRDSADWQAVVGRRWRVVREILRATPEAVATLPTRDYRATIEQLAEHL